MKRLTLTAILAAVALLAACNKIPNESIYTELDSATIKRATKADTAFAQFYEGVHEIAQFYNHDPKYEQITYRRLYNYIKSFSDTTEIQKLNNGWEAEWEELSADNLRSADSLIVGWPLFLDAHPEIDIQEGLSKSDPQVPLTIAGCIMSKDDPQLYAWVRDLMITAEIDSNHVGKNSYLDSKFVEYSKDKDSLCYLFIFSGMLEN